MKTQNSKTTFSRIFRLPEVEESVYIKKTPTEKESKKGREVNITELSKKLYGNAKKKIKKKPKKL